MDRRLDRRIGRKVQLCLHCKVRLVKRKASVKRTKGNNKAKKKATRNQNQRWGARER